MEQENADIGLNEKFGKIELLSKSGLVVKFSSQEFLLYSQSVNRFMVRRATSIAIRPQVLTFFIF